MIDLVGVSSAPEVIAKLLGASQAFVVDKQATCI